MSGHATLVTKGWILRDKKVNRVQWNWSAGLGNSWRRQPRAKGQKQKVRLGGSHMPCPKCGVSLNVANLAGHLNRVHPSVAPHPPSTKIIVRSQHSEEHKVKLINPRQCPRCHEICRSYKDLKTHLMRVHRICFSNVSALYSLCDDKLHNESN